MLVEAIMTEFLISAVPQQHEEVERRKMRSRDERARNKASVLWLWVGWRQLVTDMLLSG